MRSEKEVVLGTGSLATIGSLRGQIWTSLALGVLLRLLLLLRLGLLTTWLLLLRCSLLHRVIELVGLHHGELVAARERVAMLELVHEGRLLLSARGGRRS